MKRLKTSFAIALGLLALAGPALTREAFAQANTNAQKNLTPEQKARIEAARKKAAAQKAQKDNAQKVDPKKTTATKPPRKQDKPATAGKPDRKPVSPAVSRPVTTKPPVTNRADSDRKPPKRVDRPNTKPVGTPEAAGTANNQNKRWRNPNVRRQPPNQPVVITPAGRPNTAQNPAFVRNPPPSGPYTGLRNLDQLKTERKKVVTRRGNAVVIKEPDQRTIVRRNNKSFIVHNETNRLQRQRNVRNVRTERQGRNNVTIIERPNNVQIYNITDNSGQLVRRYRRDADGRETVLIDNESRRKKSRWGRNLAIGLGVGAGIVAGAAILNAAVDVPPPRVGIPRDKYIVDYEDANDEDVYEAFSAPPVDRIERRYTLDEVRATHHLRERMRRVDLSDITFETGSWEVSEGQYAKLERAARGLLRVIERNPNEIFMIEGYTDAVGSEEDNLSLSDRRAETVAVILSEEFGVPAENLTTQGYGEEYLKIPTEGPERLNRRVALRRITPLISQSEQR
jgi:outer membrane protein OmpA-like peptidoglycan-associated protein